MTFYNCFNNLNITLPTFPALDSFNSFMPKFNMPIFPAINFNDSFNFNRFSLDNNLSFNKSIDGGCIDQGFVFKVPTFNAPTLQFDYSSSWMRNSNLSDFRPLSVDFSNFTFSPIVTQSYNYSSSTSSTNSSSPSSFRRSSYLYANLSRSEALIKAKNDSNLELLTNGNGWSISSGCFTNDIPYAKKGTGALLSKISAEIGEDLVVTSALGTKTSPHAKGNSDCSHYNDKNPKLDFGGGLNYTEATSLANKLRNTNYFSRVVVEANGDGNYHLDVQIKDGAYNSLNFVA